MGSGQTRGGLHGASGVGLCFLNLLDIYKNILDMSSYLDMNEGKERTLGGDHDFE